MKWLIRIVVVIILLLVVGVGVLLLSLDHIVKTVVESQGTEELKVPTTLSAVSLGLTKGTVDLAGLGVGSPAGFTAPEMFSVGKLAVDTGGLGRLRDEPIRISTIAIDAPVLVIEQHDLKLNFKELMNNLPSSPDTAAPATTSDGKPATKLVIDLLTISNAHVKLLAGIPGLDKEQEIVLPTMTMAKIGNADGANNGVAIKDVVLAVIMKMVAETTHQPGVPMAVQTLLSGDLNDVQGKLTGAAQSELNKLKLPGDLGKNANDAAGGLIKQGLGVFDKK
jgi:hypothetical protein